MDHEASALRERHKQRKSQSEVCRGVSGPLKGSGGVRGDFLEEVILEPQLKRVAR